MNNDNTCIQFKIFSFFQRKFLFSISIDIYETIETAIYL